jgi:cob(I)alamin adenosyltransferase
MKIYTKQGDGGGTGLFGGQRVSKDDDRIEACGTVDELCAALGVVCAVMVDAEMTELLQDIQRDLFVMGAQLATPAPAVSPSGELGLENVQRLEQVIDRYEARLSPLKNFILPGGGQAAAQLHAARVVCRRAERRLVTLARHTPLGDQLIPYLNRLSDLLFVLARSANADAGIDDLAWRPRERGSAGEPLDS